MKIMNHPQKIEENQKHDGGHENKRETWKQAKNETNMKIYIYIILTVMNSPHFLLSENDLVTRMWSAQTSRTDFKTNFFVRRHSSGCPNLTRAFLTRILGWRPAALPVTVMATAHTAQCVFTNLVSFSISRCFVCCAQFELSMKECISAGEHHDRDKAPVLFCSVTQLDLTFNMRERKDVLAWSTCSWFSPPWKCSRIFISPTRTPGRQKFHHVEIGTSLQDWFAENTLW